MDIRVRSAARIWTVCKYMYISEVNIRPLSCSAVVRESQCGRDWQFLGAYLSEGMDADEKRKKTKIIPGTQPKVRAGWPKRLRLTQATP